MSNRGIVFLSCFLLVSGLAAVDFFNPSLPYMMADLGASQSQIKGLIVVYLLVLGLSQFFYGSFSDRFGRKPAVVLSFAIATLGLIASSFAANVWYLYGARALTAFGTAGCTVISRAVIVDSISDSRSVKQAFSYFAMASQISPSLAPLAGGFIQAHFGWHWSFATLAAIMALSWLVLVLWMPETHYPQRQSTRSYFEPYAELLMNFRFMVYSLSSALVFVFTIGYYATSPFAFHALGYSPIQNSLFYLAYSVALLSGSWATATLLVKIPSAKTYSWTIIYFLVGFAGFFFIPLDTQALLIAIFSFFVGFGCGVSAPLTLVLSMSGVEKERGAASALQGAIKMFFTGIFMLLFDLFHISSFVELLYIFFIVALCLGAIGGSAALQNKYANKKPL